MTGSDTRRVWINPGKSFFPVFDIYLSVIIIYSTFDITTITVLVIIVFIVIMIVIIVVSVGTSFIKC